MNPLSSELPFHVHNWLIISLKNFCIVIRKWPTFWPSIEVPEKVQHRATRMVPGLKRLPYEDRLRRLDIYSLTARRLRGDLIETYKLLHGYTNVDYRIFFQKHDDHPDCTDHDNTREHDWKLLKPQSKKGLQCRVHFFSQSVIICANIMFMFVLYFRLLLINMFVFYCV